MKVKDFKSKIAKMSKTELLAESKKLSAQIVKLRLDISANKTTNYSEIRKLKRDYARILTQAAIIKESNEK